MPILDVQNLRYYYRTRRGPVKAVDDLSFSVDSGKTIAIVGESGCGKTSTATAILRLLPRNVDTYEGHVFLEGMDVMALSNEDFRKQVRWRGISMVFQGAMNALSPTTRCGYQVAEPLVVHFGQEKEEALGAAAVALRSVGLPEYVVDRYPHELSGGMKQRVVIAMALVMRPRVVILDEPTSALDVMTQANIINLLKRLQAEAGLAYVFITHDLGLASELADQVAIMYAGRIAELGMSGKVYPGPKHPYTQKLIQSVPRLRSEEAPDFIPGAPPDLTKPPEGCRFHPRCPYAFKLCGWSSSEIAELLGGQAPELMGGVGPVFAAAKFGTQDLWKLVVTPANGESLSAVADAIKEMLASRTSALPYLKAVEEVSSAGGRVIVKLHEAKLPELMGDPDQRAACWLVTEEGRAVAGG